MKKIAYNGALGVFDLSDQAIEMLKKLNVKEEYLNRYSNIKRDNIFLIKVIEELSELSSRNPGDIKIIEIPDDVNWAIIEFDGSEFIVDKDRVWGYNFYD